MLSYVASRVFSDTRKSKLKGKGKGGSWGEEKEEGGMEEEMMEAQKRSLRIEDSGQVFSLIFSHCHLG
ncbi:hypothetical protein SLEP1_g52702 [Rubroshorea leprosula]|uniref:Uncharacterized protein n=1 Tax=Rubroshorea leprosula TaxID=152421 RepID=A0AAV5M9T1_9ROSI|nr:hypothetical protein SLEP1_g52702 [Rubroshorea leprosula]